MDIYEDFLELLDAAIARSGNAKRLAELLGVNPALLTRWKRKERKPSLHQIQPIIDYMGVTWTWAGRETAESPDGASGETGVQEGGITARREEAGDGGELARLKAELAAEKAMTARLERLLTTALSGRGAAAEPPAAPEHLKRKAG